MFTQEEISKRIRDQLFILDPEISLDLGTPERKIVDAVSQSLAEVQIERFIQNYTFDIDTKFGQDLDDFVQLFGFARQTAKRAIGFVTFQRSSPAPAPIFIPAKTQVSAPETAISPQVLFTTIADAIIPESGSYVETPIEATVPGEIGNITANKITSIISDINSIASVSNSTPTVGGSEQETDEELRVRFKANIFRNIAGVDDQFLAIAIANEFTNRATVIGPETKFSEYVSVPAGGTVTSSNPHAKEVYDFGYFLTSQGDDTSTFYSPSVDYSLGTLSYVDGVTNKKRPYLVSAAVANPSPATAAIAGTAGTGVLNGSFEYAYTYVYSVGGESTLAPISNTVTFSAQAGTVTNITIGSGTSAAGGTAVWRKIYRKESGVWGNVGTVLDNTTTVFYDNTLALGDLPPSKELGVGSVAFFEHRYLSANSRNYNYIDSNGNSYQTLNKIDVYLSGQDVASAQDVVKGPGNLINNNSASKYYYLNYVRGNTTTNISIGNYLIPLLWTPLRTLPSNLVVNGVTYTLNTDYWLARDISNLRQSIRSGDGIEVKASMGTAINNSNLVIDYTFDKLPLLVNKIIDSHKQAGQDVLVHTANFRNFLINLVIIYKNGFNKASVDLSISNNLTEFFNAQPFGAIIQLNDLVQIVYQTAGVDNAKIATSADVSGKPYSTYYGVQEMDSTGSVKTTYTTDLFLGDIDLPTFYGLGPTFGGGTVPIEPLQLTQSTWT